jgi:hypothetical protein
MDVSRREKKRKKKKLAQLLFVLGERLEAFQSGRKFVVVRAKPVGEGRERFQAGRAAVECRFERSQPRGQIGRGDRRGPGSPRPGGSRAFRSTGGRGVFALTGSGTALAAGGDFTKIGGVAQQGFARFLE